MHNFLRSPTELMPEGLSSGLVYRAQDKPLPEVVSMDVLREDSIDGVVIRFVHVKDAYFPTTEHEQLIHNTIQEKITSFEEALQSNDQETVLKATEEGRVMLDSSPTIREWKKWMTTAMALYPLQRPNAPSMLDGTPVDRFAQELFLYGQDSVGIRSRGIIFANLLRQRDGRIENILSLACGAAVPECDAMAAMVHKPTAVFVDMDERALSHLDHIASETGVSRDSYKSVQAHLVKEFMFAQDRHPDMPENSFDVVDALGITEYFSDEAVSLFLKKSYECVKPGGVLVFGNMLDTHPTLQFNKQIVQWPGVLPRSKEGLVRIASQITDGSNVNMYIPEDGVYAVLEIQKPLNGHAVNRPIGRTALL